MTDKPEEVLGVAADKAVDVLATAAGKGEDVLAVAATKAQEVVATAAGLAATALDAMSTLAKRRFRWTLYLLGVLFVVIGIQAGVVVHFYAEQSSDQATITTLKTKNASLGDAVKTLDKSLGADHGESVQLFCSILNAVHDTSTVYMQYCPVVIP